VKFIFLLISCLTGSDANDGIGNLGRGLMSEWDFGNCIDQAGAIVGYSVILGRAVIQYQD